MGQKVHPKGFRLGIYVGWDSRWFARDSYGANLLEDIKIRKYLLAKLNNAEVSRIEIEKAGDGIRIIIHSARPGVIIGKKGQEIESLKQELGSLLKRSNIEISVQEVQNPALDAMIIAKGIADQIEKRGSIKKITKRAMQTSMDAGARGIRIRCSGRLGGAEIARSEWLREGTVPLHKLRCDVDYGFAQAKTTYGIIGVKVWISRGEYQQA